MKAQEHGDRDLGSAIGKRVRGKRPEAGSHGRRASRRRVVARLGASPAGSTTREDGHCALSADAEVAVPAGYRPSPDEDYMNARQLAYFRQKLRAWREQLVDDTRESVEEVRDEERDVADDAERAARETQNALELRARNRDRNLIGKIDTALLRIEQGGYGYCAETGEPIGIERLEARPIATLSLEAQERREYLQKQQAGESSQGA